LGVAAATAQPQRRKSFCAAFFKKRLLAPFSAAPSGAFLIHAAQPCPFVYAAFFWVLGGADVLDLGVGGF
jgi:hypothetical protein